MTLVFNELSARDPAPNIYDARERAADMVQAIAELAGERAANLVAIDSFDLYGVRLADGYTLHQWLTDQAVDRDLQTLLWTISTKVSFDQDVPGAIKDRFFLSEFRYDDQDAAGLGLAYLLGTAAVSLRSGESWASVRLRLRHTWIEVDERVHSQEVVALNLADRSQAEEVNNDLLKFARDELTGNPTGLADRKQECFPHLAFGVDVDDQLSDLSGDVIEQVVGKLIVLDGAVRDWRRNASESPVLPKVHSESESTIEKYGNRRVFRDRHGVPKEYGSHAMVGFSYRIHFVIDQRNRVLEIGYIGKHLPTATVPH